MDSIDVVCCFPWIIGTSLSSSGCCSSSIGDDTIADAVDNGLSSDIGFIGASSSDCGGAWDVTFSSCSPDEAAPLIRSTLTGNSLEKVSVFIGLVNAILAITLLIVGSVKVVARDAVPLLLLIGNGVGDEDVFNKVPLGEYTFITPFTKSLTIIGSWTA